MRKRLVVGLAVAIAVGAWAAAPFVTGMWAERAFRTNLENLSGHPQVDIEVTAYSRHYLGAEAESRLTLKAPEDTLRIRLHHDIEHGPTFSLPALARITTTPAIAEDQAKVAAYYFGDQAPLKSQVRIGLTGAQHATFSSPAYHGALHNDRSVDVDWQGLSGEAEVSAGQDRVTLALTAPGLEVSGQEGSMAMQGLSARSRMRKQAEHLWLGESDLGLEQLTMDLPNRKDGGRIQAQVAGIKGDSAITEGKAADLLRVDLGWGFEKATVDSRHFKDGALAMELHNIDRAAYRELQERATNLQSADLTQEQLADQNLALLQELLPRFLGRSPTLKVTRLQLETDDGRMQGTARAAYRGDREVEALPANPALMLQRLNAHARLTLDKPLLMAVLKATAENKLAGKDNIGPEQAKRMAPRVAQMRLGMLQGMNILVAEDGKYSVEASWEEGSVTVNGRPLGMGMGGGTGQTPMPGGGPGMP